MPKSMENHNPYQDNFLTPMAERRRGNEPGPELLSAPLVDPPDPLGFLKTKGTKKYSEGKQGNNANTAKRK
jgi:hypothetical protein